MTSTQLPYLKALIQTAFTKQVPTDVDWAQADWAAIVEFVIANNHQALVARALRLLGPKTAGIDPNCARRITTAAAEQNMAHQRATLKFYALVKEWAKEGKTFLAIGGMANEIDYPSGALRAATTLVGSFIYTKGADAKPAGTNKGETVIYDDLTLTTLENLVPAANDKAFDRVAPVLEEAFNAAPCSRGNIGLQLYPNHQFRALYQLVKGHQDLTDNVMTLRAVVDWAMLLCAIGAEEPDFDWETLRQRCEALELMPLAQAMTAAARQLTGLTMPAAGFDTTGVNDEDVELLLTTVLENTEGLPVGRIASMREAFNNSRKYSRLLGVSPLKTALKRLFK